MELVVLVDSAEGYELVMPWETKDCVATLVTLELAEPPPEANGEARLADTEPGELEDCVAMILFVEVLLPPAETAEEDRMMDVLKEPWFREATLRSVELVPLTARTDGGVMIPDVALEDPNGWEVIEILMGLATIPAGVEGEETTAGAVLEGPRD